MFENAQDGAQQLGHGSPTVDFVQAACAMSALQLLGLGGGIVASDAGLRIPTEALEWTV